MPLCPCLCSRPRRKLADTPFPFPWAQTIIVFLLIYTLTVPIMVAAYISNAWLATLLSFIAGGQRGQGGAGRGGMGAGWG